MTGLEALPRLGGRRAGGGSLAGGYVMSRNKENLEGLRCGPRVVPFTKMGETRDIAEV